MAPARSLAELDRHLVGCRACGRLVAWREIAPGGPNDDGSPHWARPVPGFGDPRASIVVVGLAPSAYGANRTGRLFTGDKSADFLIAALHAAGLASQPTSVSANDGLRLLGLRLSAPVHCVPPGNKPTSAERRRCGPYLAKEFELLAETMRVIVPLGGFGWTAVLTTLAEQGWQVPRPRPRFGHGVPAELRHNSGRTVTMLGAYHPSPQNTNTGKLTPEMFAEVLATAKAIASSS